MRLDPNKLYESSDEEQEEQVLPRQDHSVPEATVELPKPVQATVARPQLPQETVIQPKSPVNVPSAKQRRNIFHCKYCDVVFSDAAACSNHENCSHDQLNPYDCAICSLKFGQHQNLIVHIKEQHNIDKPFICVQCSKNFIRRSDLKKHIFVHAGIRMYSCNLCSKSFTRSTNLAKHKKTHLDQVQKNFKCTLCPKAFVSTVELSAHMEIHMNRNTFNCKYCNQVFTQRDELDVHQKTHIAPQKPQVVQISPQPTTSSIVFYNQNPLEQQQQVVPQNTPMNFYTENHPPPVPVQPAKIEYPIMNQLLSNFFKCEKCFEQFPSLYSLQNHQSLHHSKNFSCGICGSSYYKKKELDRHMISAHTDIRYNCSKCSKSFGRKDKLVRHEKTHLIPAFYNCALCPAVFIRKHLLDIHSKIHMIPNTNAAIDSSALVNSLNLEQYSQPQPVFQQAQSNESYIPSLISPIKQRSPLDLSSFKGTDQPAVLYPMNLSLNEPPAVNEPMDLSNDCVSITKIEPPRIVIESDDDADLKIVENNQEKVQQEQEIHPKTETVSEENGNGLGMSVAEHKVQVPMEDLSFNMSARLADLDKLEPSKDLPMEILQSPGI